MDIFDLCYFYQLHSLNEAIIDVGLLIQHQRCRTRNEVTNSSLPSPDKSAWATLYHCGNDTEFITQVGIGKKAFADLLPKFEQCYTHKNKGGKGGRPCKVDNAQALGMLLQFYCSKVELKSLAMCHGVRPNTCSRIIKKAEYALNSALRDEPLARIRFPSKNTQRKWAATVKKKFPRISGRFGFVDGKNYTVKVSTNPDVQNSQYNGWLHSHLITGVLCFGVDGTIIWRRHNCPGSWNDSDMSRGLHEKLMDTGVTDADCGLVSDSAFPALTNGKIISPLKENELDGVDRRMHNISYSRSREITSLRQACEWGVGSVSKAWRQLDLPLPLCKTTRKTRIDNILRLWNFRVRTTGRSQIRNFFKPSK